MAVDVNAALAGGEDGWDEGTGVEGWGDDVDGVFGVAQGGEPGGVLWGRDRVVGWRAIWGAVNERHRVGGGGGVDDIRGHERAWWAWRGVGVGGEIFVDGVVQQAGDSLQVYLSGFGGKGGLAAGDFACDVVVVVGVVCGVFS